MTVFVPPKVGWSAAPRETGNVNTFLPSEDTLIRSKWPSTVEIFAAPVDIDKVRLSS